MGRQPTPATNENHPVFSSYRLYSFFLFVFFCFFFFCVFFGVISLFLCYFTIAVFIRLVRLLATLRFLLHTKTNACQTFLLFLSHMSLCHPLSFILFFYLSVFFLSFSFYWPRSVFLLLFLLDGESGGGGGGERVGRRRLAYRCDIPKTDDVGRTRGPIAVIL